MEIPPNNFTPKFECKPCNITCNKQSDWNRHILTNKHKKHTKCETDQKIDIPLDCEICEKHFSSKYELKKHMTTKLHNNNVILQQNYTKEKPDLTVMLVELLCNNDTIQHLNEELCKQFAENNQNKKQKRVKSKISDVNQSSDICKPVNAKKKKLIPLTLKRKVWSEQIGEDIGKTKCLCCRLTDISQMNFHCGHIISEANGGEIKVDNLRPICQSCNSSMGTVNMDVFMNKYGL